MGIFPLKDERAIVSSISHVILRARILDPKLTRHDFKPETYKNPEQATTMKNGTAFGPSGPPSLLGLG